MSCHRRIYTYNEQMSELHEFLTKSTSKFSGVSCRKLYGLDSFYLKEKPYIVISSEDEIVIWIDDLETRKTLLNSSQISKWKLNGRVMESWFVLPKSFNKKKNKLFPVLEMTSKVLLNPKKKKRDSKKNKLKKSAKGSISKVEIKKANLSIFKKIINLFN
jgi:hypothetical protein